MSEKTERRSSAFLQEFGPERTAHHGLQRAIEGLEVLAKRRGAPTFVGPDLKRVRAVLLRLDSEPRIKRGMARWARNESATYAAKKAESTSTLAAMRSPIEGELSGWLPIPSYMATIRRGDRRLMVGCQGLVHTGTFQVIAIETRAKLGNALDFLDDHAHHLLAEEKPTLEEAQALAKEYAEKWAAGTLPAAEACGCGEIATPPAVPAPVEEATS